jgi:beta-galactosidase
MNAVNEWAEVPREGIPGKKLSEVFGIQEIDAYTDGKFLLNGEHIDGNFQNQLLEAVDGAEIIARTEDGYPAVVMNHYGRGKTLYFNTFLGAAMEQGVPKPVDKLLRELTAAQCPDAIFMEKDEQLHVSFLKQGIRRMMLLVNFAWEEKTLKFCNVKKTLILRNIVTGQETSGNGDFTMKAPSGEQIFELKEQT